MSTHNRSLPQTHTISAGADTAASLSKGPEEVLNTSAERAQSKSINIGSRKSKLAVIQTEIVHSALRRRWPDLEFELHTMSTAGDKDKVTPLHDMNAKSLWTQELEALLLDGRLDMIVHSLKDIPTQLPPTLDIGAIFPREDARDALVMKPSLSYTSLTSLPPDSVVGTSSIRRTAQIARKFPHLRFENVRGNIDTRLSKLDAEDGKYSCIILAAAGLQRMGLGHRITQFLDSTVGTTESEEPVAGEGWLHAVGQGALAVEIREGDDRIRNLLNELACPKTTHACLTERSLMRTLEGGCSVPIGVETQWLEDGETLLLRASVTSTDGKRFVAATQSKRIVNSTGADEFGRSAAKELIDKGAGPILEQITLNRDVIDA